MKFGIESQQVSIDNRDPDSTEITIDNIFGLRSVTLEVTRQDLLDLLENMDQL